MKRQLALACTCTLLAVTALPAFASNGDISIVASVDAGSPGNTRECDFYQLRYRGNTQGNPFGSCSQQITLQIYAVLKGASAGGITGCEFLGSVGPTAYPNSAPFKHESAADPGWVFSELPSPTAAVRLGTPSGQSIPAIPLSHRVVCNSRGTPARPGATGGS